MRPSGRRFESFFVVPFLFFRVRVSEAQSGTRVSSKTRGLLTIGKDEDEDIRRYQNCKCSSSRLIEVM